MKKGTSKYDSYREEIADMLSAGMSIAKIADRLSGHEELYPVHYETLYWFIRNNGLHSMDYRGNKTVKPPLCDSCTDCTEKLDFEGTGTLRECIPARQMIRKGVRTSPEWCPRRRR